MRIKNKSAILGLSLIATSFLIVGCGSSSSESLQTGDSALTGQLVDSFISKADYRCGDGKTGVTDINGSFSCQTFPVTFSIGGLKLGSINAFKADKLVFPQDLVGVDRNETNNSVVVAMAQFLQSCDTDKNPANGIDIDETIKANLEDINETFEAENLDAYETEYNITMVSEDEAQSHLEQTTQFVESVDKLAEHGKNLQGHEYAQDDKNITDALLTPATTLTQETKNTLSYMGNEERLAYDVYMTLYTYHQQNSGVEIKQLYNIATNGESQHIAAVQALVKKYISSLDEFNNTIPTTPVFDTTYATKSVSELPSGVYNVEAIQNLYDTLVEKGKQSEQDALEVGCMVEVTDIDDLDTDILTAQTNGADDIVQVFNFLRDGSYQHYQAFDNGLKNMGITDGCCSLGEEYCHPEYPKSANTQGKQKGRH